MFTIQLVKDPIYMTEDGKVIHLTVKFEEFPEAIGFVAVPDDPEEHGQFLYKQAIAGVYGPVRPYTPPPEGADDGKSNSS